MIKRIMKWFAREFADWANNFARDLKSIRSLWNWLLLSLFFYVIIHLTRHNAAICGNTIVVTLGTLVSYVFTAYVWSSHQDKKLGYLRGLSSIQATVPMGSDNENPIVAMEEPASDQQDADAQAQGGDNE
jgi:ABC-type proline/glycine betaine transport system permease subunit